MQQKKNKNTFNKRLLQAIVKGEDTKKVPRHIRQVTDSSESEIQQACLRWFKLQYPRLAAEGMLFHIANEGVRIGAMGGRLQREGLVRGVADLCLCIPSHGFHALYIEMKRPKTIFHAATYQSPEQREWQKNVEKYGNKYVVCHSVEEFMDIVKGYLNVKSDEKSQI